MRPLTTRIIGGLGRTLIAAGLLVLAFVAYQLWGTGLHEQRAQHQLTEQFNHLLQTDTSTPSTLPGGEGEGTKSPSSTPATLPADPAATTAAPAEGDPIGRIEIPELHLSKIMVQGVGTADLERGPGHYPQTPLPGQAGNAGIAGHRTTYGAPFFNVDQLKPGDPILITTVQGHFTYHVTGTQVVAPSDVSVLDNHHTTTGALRNELTLTACDPKWSATKRIIISAELVGNPVPRLPGQRAHPQRSVSLSGAPAPKWPAILWGALAAVVVLVAWLLARRWRTRKAAWLTYLCAAPVFLVVLFVFFENVSLLLPPNF